MDVHAQRDELKWEPIKLTLTFNSQREVDTFYALFNYTPVCSAVMMLQPDNIRDKLRPWVNFHNSDNIHTEIRNKIKERIT